MNVVITGAGKGIGLELCKYFLVEGATHIFAISRNTSELDFLQPFDNRITPIAFDLKDEDYSILQKSITGTVDILINNAGHLVNKPFLETTANEVDQTFDINYKAAFRLIQMLYPNFQRGTHIVNIGSMGGFQGSTKFKGLSVYSASKAALACLTECIAEELKDSGIICNCLALGAVQTDMLRSAFPQYEAPVKAHEMAKFIGDFAINAKSFISGKIIPIAISTP